MYKMEQTNIVNYVNECVKEFMSYIGVNTFPAFSILTKEMNLERGCRKIIRLDDFATPSLYHM